jgi:hypothetical protein
MPIDVSDPSPKPCRTIHSTYIAYLDRPMIVDVESSARGQSLEGVEGTHQQLSTYPHPFPLEPSCSRPDPIPDPNPSHTHTDPPLYAPSF